MGYKQYFFFQFLCLRYNCNVATKKPMCYEIPLIVGLYSRKLVFLVFPRLPAYLILCPVLGATKCWKMSRMGKVPKSYPKSDKAEVSGPLKLKEKLWGLTLVLPLPSPNTNFFTRKATFISPLSLWKRYLFLCSGSHSLSYLGTLL